MYNYEIQSNDEDGLCLESEGYKVALNEKILKESDKLECFESTLFGICSNDDECDDNDFLTSNKCDTVTRQCVFSQTSECYDHGAFVTVTVKSRDFPSTVMWKIESSASGDIVAFAGPFETPGITSVERQCLVAGEYKLTMYKDDENNGGNNDEFGDYNDGYGGEEDDNWSNYGDDSDLFDYLPTFG